MCQYVFVYVRLDQMRKEQPVTVWLVLLCCHWPLTMNPQEPSICQDQSEDRYSLFMCEVNNIELKNQKWDNIKRNLRAMIKWIVNVNYRALLLLLSYAWWSNQNIYFQTLNISLNVISCDILLYSHIDSFGYFCI